MVQRDIRKFSALSSMDDSIAPQRRGRIARSDQVASCLLMREYAGAMPVRREVMVARNRRRLKIVFGLVLVWWGVGWLML
jgi:hypothetical protein